MGNTRQIQALSASTEGSGTEGKMSDWLTHWAPEHYNPEILSWREIPGYLGSLLIIGSLVVRTMIPLRAERRCQRLHRGKGENCWRFARAVLPEPRLQRLFMQLAVERLFNSIRLLERQLDRSKIEEKV